MACEVRTQPTALRELENAVAYLSGFGPSTARAFLGEWEKVLEGLRDGSVEHALSRFEVLARLGYRAVLVKGYVLLFFEDGDEAVVAHLFHQSRDYANIVLRGV